jgi:tyrosine-protein phosphatase SIW14
MVRTTLLLTPLLLIALGCAPATVGESHPGLYNVGVVDKPPSAIYRGAQPTPQGIATLKNQFKVKTVIDLRDDAVGWERAACTAVGINYVRIPSNAAVVDEETIQTFLETLRKAKSPVFVHCREGRDRTGLEVAVYRIVDEHWTREAAIEELERHGYNRFWFPGIERYLRTFDPETKNITRHKQNL